MAYPDIQRAIYKLIKIQDGILTRLSSYEHNASFSISKLQNDLKRYAYEHNITHHQLKELIDVNRSSYYERQIDALKGLYQELNQSVQGYISQREILDSNTMTIDNNERVVDITTPDDRGTQRSLWDRLAFWRSDSVVSMDNNTTPSSDNEQEDNSTLMVVSREDNRTYELIMQVNRLREEVTHIQTILQQSTNSLTQQIEQLQQDKKILSEQIGDMGVEIELLKGYIQDIKDLVHLHPNKMKKLRDKREQP